MVATRTYHCSTQFMHPGPCSIVTAKTKNTLQSKCAGSILLARYKPDSKEPAPQRLVCFVKQCSSSNGCLPFAFAAQKKTPAHNRRVFFKNSARRATKTLRPPECQNICKASLFGAKPLIKFLECSRIVNVTNRMPLLFHR